MRMTHSVQTAFIIFSGLVLVMGSAVVCQAQQEKVYICGIDPGYPPYQYVDEKGNVAGFDVECTKWMSEKMGFKVEIKPTAWDGIIPSLKAKKIDFLPGMAVSPERAAQVDFTEPYRTFGYVVVVRKDSDLTPATALSLGHTIGTLRGSTETIWIEDNLVRKGIDVKLKTYETAVLVIEDLINGRIDAGVMSTPPVKDALKKKRPFKIVGPLGIPDRGFAYAVRKGDKELLAILNEGLKRLKRSDEWEKLLAKYGID